MSGVANDAPSPLVTVRLADYESAPVAVVRAVAAVEDERPTALPPLADTIDADALRSLVETGGDAFRISFEYCGYRVVVTTATAAVY